MRRPSVDAPTLPRQTSLPVREPLEIVGRQSSHYTRLVRIFAAELGVPYRLTPIFDLTSREPGTFAGNPALKLPILRVGDDTVFGSVNICRAIARHATGQPRIVWPETVDGALLVNAHELLSHAMAVHVEVILHELVEKRPADATSRKRRESLVHCLAWLDRNLDAILAALPARDLSVLEVGLFCLVSHLPFRNPIDLSGMPALTAFERSFGERASALETPYRFDVPASEAS